MNKLLNFLKQNRLPVPIWLGLILARIPYGLRPGLGESYNKQRNAITAVKTFSQQEKERYIFANFHSVFSHAFHNIKFYNDLYTSHNLIPEDLKSFDDISKVPVITKQELSNYSIEDRSFPVANRLLVNTGGSSGKPFAFYMDPNRYGNEWAHVHDMWKKFDFSPKDLKLSFDGRAKEKNKIAYDFARNSLLYDIYADHAVLAKQLLKIIKKYPIKYLHGYPSAIYQFAICCGTNQELLSLLRKQLKAAFLSSEYPSPHYRNKIQEVFGIPTQSFYGHTETCVLAVEDEDFIYNTYQTYGYAEAVKAEDKTHLVGTSYFNFASPLIRYNTSDSIEPINNSNILEKFVIKEGRTGEFILDKNSKKIPLTGLIYGRHHDLFNISEHVQVFQNEPGIATIVFVSKDSISENDASKYFNATNIDIDFLFLRRDEPIFTSSGKINLMVKTL